MLRSLVGSEMCIRDRENVDSTQTNSADSVNEETSVPVVNDNDVVVNNVPVVVLDSVKADEDHKETPDLKQEEQSAVNTTESEVKETPEEPNNTPKEEDILKAEESLSNDDKSDLNESDSNSKTTEKKKKLFSFSIKNKKKKEKERSSSLLDVNADPDEIEMSDKKETQNATVQRAQSMSHFDREPKSKSKIPLHKFRSGKKKSELAASTSNVDSTSLVLNPGMDDWRMSGLLGTMESNERVILELFLCMYVKEEKQKDFHIFV